MSVCVGVVLVSHVLRPPSPSLALLQGPDYRLYKSEPELTTVAEVDESNGEDKTGEQAAEKEPASTKGASTRTVKSVA